MAFKTNGLEMKISDNTAISMPMRNLLAILAAVAMGIFAYTEITGRLNSLETQDTLMQSDLLKKAEQTPKNLEMFMLLEESFTQIEKLQKNQEQNMTNKVNIEFLKEQMNKVLNDIEKLKDKQRSFANGTN